jgi:cell division protease FtsH
MADALMKFETIDAEQIDDIMSGRTPRPPADWDESEPRAGGVKGRAKTDEGKGSEGTLGTPAGQH